MPEPKSRMTRQKRAILEELTNSDSHPTADEIYNRVRQKLPKISLGTVYRNLESLSEVGMVKKLDVGSPQKRYDGRNESHYHILCKKCDRVDDLFIEQEFIPEDVFASACGYNITGHQLTLFGLCPDCKEKEKN